MKPGPTIFVSEDVSYEDLASMSFMERISLLPEEDRDAFLEEFTDVELTDYRMWLRPKQIAVVDDTAPIIVMASGRGGGKTKTGAAWLIEKARTPGRRLHIVGRTVADVRDVMVQGESGIINSSPLDFVPEYVPSVRRLIWPNGTVAITHSAETPDSLRGPQADYTWCDELATFSTKPDASGATTWDNVLISTRLGARPQILATTTPRRTSIIRQLFTEARDGSGRVSLHGGSMYENRANLAPEYLANMTAMYAGTPFERQELYGELLEEVAGALWRESDFIRLAPDVPLEELFTVIGVDPNVRAGGDSTGIVTVRGTNEAVHSSRRAWVVRDDSEEVGLAPERWAQRVLQVWKDERDLTGRVPIVVAEGNQGWELVSTVIHQLEGGRDVPIALVGAKGTKVQRAEQVLLPYRRKRVFHPEEMPALEDELTTWEEDSKWSPGRMDAMVHALRALLVDDKALKQFGQIEASSGDVIRFERRLQRRDRMTGGMRSGFRDPHNPRERH